MNNRSKNPARIKPSRASRTGAILLDLFLATLMFVGCVLAISQLGVQSLQLSQNTSIERLAILKAESTLARETSLGKMPGARHENRQWNESLHGVPFAIRTTWQSTEQLRLEQLQVHVQPKVGSNQPSRAVTLQRLVYQHGEPSIE